MSEESDAVDLTDLSAVDPTELPEEVGAHHLWEGVPDPSTAKTLDFPRRIEDYEWTVHFAQRMFESPRPPDPETVDDVLQSGKFVGEANKRDYRFEKDYNGVTIRVVVAIATDEPIHGILVTAYPIIDSLAEATTCDRFDPEEIRRSYAASYFHGEAEFEDDGGVPDDWEMVEFDRPVTVNGHEILGKRGRPYPRCERCGRRLNYGSARQECMGGRYDV